LFVLQNIKAMKFGPDESDSEDEEDEANLINGDLKVTSSASQPLVNTNDVINLLTPLFSTI
jgi:hypothetical protein